jgi:hypothetical protein
MRIVSASMQFSPVVVISFLPTYRVAREARCLPGFIPVRTRRAGCADGSTLLREVGNRTVLTFGHAVCGLKFTYKKTKSQ